MNALALILIILGVAANGEKPIPHMPPHGSGLVRSTEGTVILNPDAEHDRFVSRNIKNRDIHEIPTGRSKGVFGTSVEVLPYIFDEVISNFSRLYNGRHAEWVAIWHTGSVKYLPAHGVENTCLHRIKNCGCLPVVSDRVSNEEIAIFILFDPVNSKHENVWPFQVCEAAFGSLSLASGGGGTFSGRFNGGLHVERLLIGGGSQTRSFFEQSGSLPRQHDSKDRDQYVRELYVEELQRRLFQGMLFAISLTGLFVGMWLRDRGRLALGGLSDRRWPDVSVVGLAVGLTRVSYLQGQILRCPPGRSMARRCAQAFALSPRRKGTGYYNSSRITPFNSIAATQASMNVAEKLPRFSLLVIEASVS